MTAVRERVTGTVNLEAISSGGLGNFLTDYQNGFKSGQSKWLIDDIDITPFEQALGLSAVTVRALLRESQSKGIINPVDNSGYQGDKRVTIPVFDRDRMLAFAALCFIFNEKFGGNRRVTIEHHQFVFLVRETREALKGSSLAELIGEPLEPSGGLDKLRRTNQGGNGLEKTGLKSEVPHPDLSEPFWQGEIGEKLADIIHSIEEQEVGFPIKTNKVAELYDLLPGVRQFDLIRALARSGAIGNVPTQDREYLFNLWNFLTGGLFFAHLQGKYSLKQAAARVAEIVKGVNGLQEASGQIKKNLLNSRSLRMGNWPYLAEASPWRVFEFQNEGGEQDEEEPPLTGEEKPKVNWQEILKALYVKLEEGKDVEGWIKIETGTWNHAKLTDLLSRMFYGQDTINLLRYKEGERLAIAAAMVINAIDLKILPTVIKKLLYFAGDITCDQARIAVDKCVNLLSGKTTLADLLNQRVDLSMLSV